MELVQMSDTQEARPLEVGDEITITDTVHSRKVIGTDLPSDMKFQDDDQRFDEFEVTVTERVYEGTDAMGRVTDEVFVVEMEDGTEARVNYAGRCPITGSWNDSIRESNSQGASQAYVWER